MYCFDFGCYCGVVGNDDELLGWMVVGIVVGVGSIGCVCVGGGLGYVVC